MGGPQRALTVAARQERQKFAAKEAARVTGQEFDEAAYDVQVAAQEEGENDEAEDLYEVHRAVQPDVELTRGSSGGSELGSGS